MNKILKLVWPYLFRWLKNSLIINGALFFAYGLVVIRSLSSISTNGISNVTTSQLKHMLQLSQQIWIGLLIFPILIATIILVIDVATDYFFYRQNKGVNDAN